MMKITFILIILCIPRTSHSQSTGSILGNIKTINRGKSILEFYKYNVELPQKIILLSIDIEMAFIQDGGNYQKLTNELAYNLNFSGFSGSKRIESMNYILLKPELNSRGESINYSITVKHLTFKQCIFLSSHLALNNQFKIITNDDTSYCKTQSFQWFKKYGTNEVKFVST